MFNSKSKYKFIHSLEKLGLHLGETLQRFNQILYGVVESKPYDLNWDEIIPMYKDASVDGTESGIEEFSFNYVVGYALVNGFSLDPALKEAMFTHLKAELIAKKAQGKLS